MCSQTSSQRSASAGSSMLRAVSFRCDMSTSRKSARKRTVNSESPMEKALPATPRIALIASGTDAERLFAPSCTFSADPESPIEDSSSESRSWATSSGRSCRKSRTEPTSGTRRISARMVAPTAEPRTTIVAESPRPRPVLRMKPRTGISKTSARKIPRKTSSSASRIETTAAASPRMSTAISSVRTVIPVSKGFRFIGTASIERPPAGAERQARAGGNAAANAAHCASP